MGKMIHQLPVEMVEEIMYKLPVKSLLRFKCVSKSWRRSISSKGFIREHLNQSRSTGTHDFSHHNLIFRFGQNSIGSCSVDSLLNDDDNDTSNLLIPTLVPSLEDNIRIIGFLVSCNGLILVTTNYKDLYLWNPSTRKIKDIRRNASFPAEEPTSYYLYGLGYDESTDDYKVIILRESFMYMYSSGIDTWKQIQYLNKGPPVGHARFVNGRLHWLTRKDIYDTWHYGDIVSLDLVEEKYQIMARPHFLSDYFSIPRLVLQDMGGYLSLFVNHGVLRAMDVWVMEKECCWSKIWTFSYIYRSIAPKTLWMQKNGDILVAFESDLVIYYHGRKDKLLRYSRVDKLNNHRMNKFNGSFPTIVYVESLVDPFALGNDHQQ